MTYLLVFTFSLLFFYRKKKDNYSYKYLIFAFFVPCFIAGMRDIAIGADTSGYVSDMFAYANKSSLKQLWETNQDTHEVEELYVIWNYVCQWLTDDFNIYLLLSHLLMFGILSFALFKRQKDLVLWFAAAIIFLVYYRQSLNAARQFLALCVCLVSLHYTIGDQYKKAILALVISYFFHHTSFIFGGVILMHWIIERYPRLFDKFITKVLFISIVAVLIIFLAYALSIVESLGLLDNRFEDRYIDQDSYGTNMPVSLFALNGFNLFIFYWIRKHNAKTRFLLFVEYILIISFIFCFAGLISTFAVRIGTYFEFCTILLLPILYRKYHVPYYALRLHMAFFLFYWYMVIVIANLGDTYPYSSAILGI